MRAHFPEARGYLLAEFLFTQSMNLGHAGFVVDVLAHSQIVNPC